MRAARTRAEGGTQVPWPGPIPSAGELAAADAAGRLRLLGSSEGGLGVPEAQARLRHFGPNVPVREEERHLLQEFLGNFTHTLALLLWFAAGLAFAAGIHELGAAILAVVLINGVFAFIQEYRAGQVVAGLLQRVALRARVVREGEPLDIEARSLVPGDVFVLEAGDVVPADAVLLSSEALAVDLSLLTGETLPVERDAAPVSARDGSRIADLAPLLPAGAGVVRGSGSGVVWRTGPQSSLGRVAGLVASVEEGESLLARQVAALSRLTAVIAVFAGTGTLALAAIIGDTSFLAALTFGTGTLVALVPEGLLPTLSVSLAIGARRMAARGAAVRHLSAVETVGATTVICTDKTGTLTENRLTVESVVTADGEGPGLDAAIRAAVLCNEAGPGPDGLEGDPFDVALWQWAEANGWVPGHIREEWRRTALQPFDPHLRYARVTCERDGKAFDFVKGAPEAVAALCQPPGLPPALGQAIRAAAARGERVLLLAAGPAGSPLSPLGVVAFHDPPRRGVSEALAACRRAGIRVVMLTGDHLETAKAVAARIGLAGHGVTVNAGAELDAMSDEELLVLLSHDAVIARVDPEQKLRIVQVLRRAGEVVLVTGDGTNDAPALRAADVGVAMGLRGTEAAKQAADIVLADDNFTTIVAAIEEGRAIKRNIRRFVSYVFTSNVAEVTPFLVYVFLPVPLPLAVIQALAIDIGTDLVPAIALGAEPPGEESMDTPPEPPGRPLITPALGALTFLFFGAIEAVLGLAGYFAWYWQAGWRPFDSFEPFEAGHSEAMAVTFLAIVGGQVACLAAQRSGPLTARLSLTRNRLIPAGLAFELALAVALVYTPGLNGLFSMSAVALPWLLAVPSAAAAFLLADQSRRGILLVMGRAAPAG